MLRYLLTYLPLGAFQLLRSASGGGGSAECDTLWRGGGSAERYVTPKIIYVYNIIF